MNRWDKIQQVFHLAKDLPSQERKRLLERECGKDTGLISEIESLINSHIAQTAFLEDVAGKGLFTSQNELTDKASQNGVLCNDPLVLEDLSGSQVGAYLLEKKLGQGGMGQVYCAIQEEPIKRRVALKLIHPGLFSHPEFQMRFKQEYQLLAHMNHPNIAQVYDAGKTSGGTVYFTMELVEGRTLSEYIEQIKPDTSELISLFVQICEGLHYAHQKGIIHRDIKPSNIIVSVETGSPICKIIDFGISKVHQAENPSTQEGKQVAVGIDNGLTVAGKLYGSPRYMPPERLNSTNGISDCRSDIFSTGVSFFQALTGQQPFSGECFEEISRSILHENPKTIREFNASYPRDLCCIVSKCLEKDMDERYTSVAELKKDLITFQNGDPLPAFNLGISYRVLKYVTKHRWFSFFTAAFILSILSLSLFHYVAIKKERDLALKEWEKAQQTSQFLMKIFEQTDPGLGSPVDMTAREVLANGLESIETHMDMMPDIKLELFLQIGKIFRHLEGYNEALATMDKAEKLARKLDDNEALFNVFNIRGVAFQNQKKNIEAEEMYRKALLYPADYPAATLQVKVNLGIVLTGQRKFDEAEAMFRDVHTAHVVDPDFYELRISYESALGMLYYSQHEDEKAVLHYNEALNLAIVNQQYDRLETAKVISNIAAIDFRQGRTEAAINGINESLEIKRRILPENHIQIAGNLANLAVMLISSGQTNRAQEHLLQCISIKESFLGSNSIGLQNTYLSLSRTFFDQNDLQNTLWALSRTDYIQEENLSMYHPSRINLNVELHYLFQEMERDQWALESIQCALEQSKQVHGNESPRTARIHFIYGSFLLNQKDIPAAKTHLKKSLQILETQPEKNKSKIEWIEKKMTEIKAKT